MCDGDYGDGDHGDFECDTAVTRFSYSSADVVPKAQ